MLCFLGRTTRQSVVFWLGYSFIQMSSIPNSVDPHPRKCLPTRAKPQCAEESLWIGRLTLKQRGAALDFVLDYLLPPVRCYSCGVFWDFYSPREIMMTPVV